MQGLKKIAAAATFFTEVKGGIVSAAAQYMRDKEIFSEISFYRGRNS